MLEFSESPVHLQRDVAIHMVVRCLYSGLVRGLPFMARVALLACVGGLAFVVCAFGGFLP